MLADRKSREAAGVGVERRRDLTFLILVIASISLVSPPRAVFSVGSGSPPLASHDRSLRSTHSVTARAAWRLLFPCPSRFSSSPS
eukprot:680700-Hanusia_phi.AAC.1